MNRGAFVWVFQTVRNLPAMQEMWVRLLGREDPLGEGMATPLQYSCLENPMDRGTWQVTVHGVAKSRTRLSDSAQHNVTPREGTASSKVPTSKREFLITTCKHVRLRDVSLIYLYPGPGLENPFLFLCLSVVHWALPGPTLDKTESHIRDFIWIVENSVFIQHSMNVQKVNSI